LQKYIGSVQGKVNDNEISETFDFVNQNLPLFLNENDYKKLRENSERQHCKTGRKQLRFSGFANKFVTKEFIKKDPLGITFLGIKKLNALNISKDFKLEDNYIVTKDGKNLLLFIDPKTKATTPKTTKHLLIS
jgi:predicted exporter